jgi:hypothetical protein
MSKEAGKRPKLLLDENWADALKGMAQALQTFKQPSGPLTDLERRLQQVANSPDSKLMKQLLDFSNSPMAKQFADMAKNVMAADMRAKHLSEAIHSASNIGDIQKVIDSEPVDAYLLLALVTLERDKEAGELEKRIAEQSRAAKSERGRQLARLMHDNSSYARIKPEVIKFYENHAGEMKPDGRPRFKTKVSFLREISKQYGDTVTDPDTIANWIAESQVKVAHWRTRSVSKKT